MSEETLSSADLSRTPRKRASSSKAGISPTQKRAQANDSPLLRLKKSIMVSK